MAININIQNKVIPDITIGSVVRSHVLGKEILRMVIFDYDNHSYRLLDLKNGCIKGKADFAKALATAYDLELVTNDIDMILYNVENNNNKEEK